MPPCPPPSGGKRSDGVQEGAVSGSLVRLERRFPAKLTQAPRRRCVSRDVSPRSGRFQRSNSEDYVHNFRDDGRENPGTEVPGSHASSDRTRVAGLAEHTLQVASRRVPGRRQFHRRPSPAQVRHGLAKAPLRAGNRSGGRKRGRTDNLPLSGKSALPVLDGRPDIDV
jgi:hypothetical protein